MKKYFIQENMRLLIDEVSKNNIISLRIISTKLKTLKSWKELYFLWKRKNSIEAVVGIWGSNLVESSQV